MRAMLAAIGVLAAVAPAAADPVEDAAQVHLDRGIAAFEKRDYPTAHRELTAANQLVPAKPNPYRWLALTEVQLGDCPRALANIEAFLARVAADDPRRAEMLRLRAMCGRTGAVAIRTTPERAQLRIDGTRVGAAPYRAGALSVGTHTIVAEAPGYRTGTHAVAVTAGGEHDVHLVLRRAKRPLTRRWWFVPAVVGVAALATGAIVLATRGDDGDPMLPGIECDGSGCRPGGR